MLGSECLDWANFRTWQNNAVNLKTAIGGDAPKNETNTLGLSGLSIFPSMSRRKAVFIVPFLGSSRPRKTIQLHLPVSRLA
jgi:hypothetical protein